jgi:hypothetical protein
VADEKTSFSGLDESFDFKYLYRNLDNNVTDEKKEKIRFNTEMIKLLLLLFIGSGGGVISLLLQGVSLGLEAIILAGGMMFAITSGISAGIVYRNTSKLIE